MVISTDKSKYNQNDDINISIVGGTEWTDKELFICKGNDIIKTVTLDDNSITVNLDNNVGLLDIYLKTNTNKYYSSSRYYNYSGYSSNYNPTTNYIKKTIFIKPDAGLGINIKTDKEEYSPKEKLNIEFNLKSENDSTIDGALLVSILDEAVLSLADNDLSIDNIKLALQDIELSDGITLADLYAEVLDNSSSMKLDTLLLKQKNSSININNKDYSSEVNRDKYLNNTITFGILIVIIAVIILLNKFKGKGKIFSFISALLICFIIAVIFASIVYIVFDYFDLISYDSSFEVIDFIISIIVTILLYKFILYKYKNTILKHMIILIVLPVIWSLIFTFIYEISYEDSSIYLIMLLVVISWCIFAFASKNSGLGKTGKKVKKILGKSIIGVGFWIITYLLASKFEYIAFIFTFIIYILLNIYIFNGRKDKKSIEIEDNKIIINPETIFAIFAMLAIISIVGIFIIFSDTATINDSLSEMDDYTSPVYSNRRTDGEYSNGRMFFDEVDSDYFAGSAADTTGTSNALGTNIFSEIGQGISDALNSSKNSSINDSMTSMSTAEDEDMIVYEENSENLNVNDNRTKEEKEEENIRNVFLESLAFIPEVVTENGKADLSLDISDNITTWNIQVIGNTKDGKLGSNSKTFKVFKEFFVDFSLPANSVIGDYVEIPVTVYNYTEGDLSVELNVKDNDWSKIGNFEKTISVPAKSTNMVYVPLEILKNGNNKLRVESKALGVTDIVEKSINVNYNGLQKEVVESTGTIEKDFTQDLLFNEKAIEGSKKIKVKLYPSSSSEIINGMENILKMPSGCFEQTSSSLYPDILVLKYLEENNLDNKEIKEKALNFISKGYQKLLTYEVSGEKGGYSLYGNSPAEPVITAFGLMEFKELSEVYEVDSNVINNMKEYLYDNQKTTGEFDYSSTYIGTAQNTDKYSMNAYIIWALSEADPEDKRLEKSIKYIESNLDNISDNYTLALIANIFANTSNKKLDEVIKRLSNNINIGENNCSYLTSNTVDYYGSRGRYQNIQATALTSIALSKSGKDVKANGELINYIISSKDSYGTWGTTQATILSLKALNDYNKKGKIKEQKITVSVNGDEQSAEVKSESLDIYEFVFYNVKDENTIKIGMKDGNISYEVVKEYYQEYSDLNESDKINVKQELNTNLKVNDIITQNIDIMNNSGETISNGIAKIYIPQGCKVEEDSLLQMKYEGLIEKYEYNYNTINVYLRNFANTASTSLKIKYRALYPEKVTGGLVEFYDYYNPEIEGISAPVEITVNK